MEDPKIQTKVVHSQSKAAWNVIGDTLGGPYKIARVPYHVDSRMEDASIRNRKEALEHADFISWCFNNSSTIIHNSQPITPLEHPLP